MIYICQDGIGASGVATYGYQVLRHYPRSRMILLNADVPPPAAPRELHKKILLVPQKRAHSPAVIAHLLQRLAKKFKEDLFILPNTGDTPWAGVARFLSQAAPPLLRKVRVLGIVHSDMESQYQLAAQYLPIAPVWMAVSGRCARVLKRCLHDTAGVVHTLFYPVEIPSQIPGWSTAGPVRLSYVGRIEEPQKKVSRLIRLFVELSKMGVDFLATVAGDGPAFADFKRSLSAIPARVRHRVILPGGLARPEINKLWKSTDIFLLVSAYEGLPLALLEAMAYGRCPVVMSVRSGLPEVLKNKINSRMTPQGNVHAMSLAIKGLFRDRCLIRKLGASARKDILERFSPENHFANLDKILGILSKMPPPAPHKLKPDPTEVAVDRLVAKIAARARPAVIYGSGMFGRKVVDACRQHGVKVCGLIDSNIARKGMVYERLVCQCVDAITDFPQAVFAIGSLQFGGEISRKIREAFRLKNLKTPPIVSVSL